MTGYEIIGLVMVGVLFLVVFIPMVFEMHDFSAKTDSTPGKRGRRNRNRPRTPIKFQSGIFAIPEIDIIFALPLTD